MLLNVRPHIIMEKHLFFHYISTYYLFYPYYPTSTRFGTEFIALSFLDDRPQLRCAVRRWTDGSYWKCGSQVSLPRRGSCVRDCEDHMNSTQLHLFKVVLS